MNMHTARRSVLTALVLLAAAAGFALHTLVVAPTPAGAEPPAARGGLAGLVGLRVVLVLRDDWLNSAQSGAQPPAANALSLAKAKLYCRIDEVHGDWLEVSTPRSTDPQVNPTTARDVWLIRTESVVAIQTGEAER